MTVSNSLPVRGSRYSRICYSRTLIAQDTTVEAIGQSNIGLPMRWQGKMVGMWSQAEWAGGTDGQTITITAYKGSVAAGNKVYETVHTQAGAAGANIDNNVTPAVSEAMCEFATGQDLILTIVTSATTGDVIELFVALDYEASIFN